MAKRKKIIAAFLLLNFWLFNGCTAMIIGASLGGVGTFTYVQGDLERSYQVSFEKALNVCIAILEDLNQPILEKTTDGEKTIIKSQIKDGSPQTIQVEIENTEWTQVSVRTGTVGYWKKAVSQQFHNFIEERLKE